MPVGQPSLFIISGKTDGFVAAEQFGHLLLREPNCFALDHHADFYSVVSGRIEDELGICGLGDIGLNALQNIISDD